MLNVLVHQPQDVSKQHQNAPQLLSLRYLLLPVVDLILNVNLGSSSPILSPKKMLLLNLRL